jgi:hypothetical protein
VPRIDLLLTGGTVIDPAHEAAAVSDVAVGDERIAGPAPVGLATSADVTHSDLAWKKAFFLQAVSGCVGLRPGPAFARELPQPTSEKTTSLSPTPRAARVRFGGVGSVKRDSHDRGGKTTEERVASVPHG